MPKTIDQGKVLKKINKIEQENETAKAARETKQRFWKEHSLKDSLYNDDGRGNRVPRVEDIDQGSYSHLDYLLKQQGINDCFLLTNLMGLARTNPSFIVNNLIKVKSNDEVNVYFYNVEVDLTGDVYKYKKSDSSPVRFSVNKSEAIEWATSHRALWPVVVEIAYAKYLDYVFDNNDDVKKARDEVRKSIEEYVKEHEGGQLSEEAFNKRVSELLKAHPLFEDKSLRDNFGVGSSMAYTLAALTGRESKARMNLNYRKLIKPAAKATSTRYSDSVLKIYNKIEGKLKNNKVIMVSFGNVTRNANFSDPDLNLPGSGDDRADLALKVIALANRLKTNAEGTINSLVRASSSSFSSGASLTQKQVDDWLKNNGMTLEKLQSARDDVRKSFILDTVYSDSSKRLVSKTRSGIFNRHAYLVLDVIDSGEYKYIILKNPLNIKTKINYQKRKVPLPHVVKEPSSIDKIKNECAMELNHFCKLVTSIHYDK